MKKAQYAESKSDIVSRLEGTYSAEGKKREKEEKAAKKAAKAANPKKRRAVEEGTWQSWGSEGRKVKSRRTNKWNVNVVEWCTAEGEPIAKRAKEVELNAPNKILFLQQVPVNTSLDQLTSLFSKFPGFKDAKIPKPELAFVFYDTESQAGVALKEYQGWKFSPEDSGLLINFAKQ